MNWLLVFILLDGLIPTGLYSTCTSMMEMPSPITPLLTSNPCLQRWFALEFLWAGMIVGQGVGFMQWWAVFQPMSLPKTWIDVSTIGWAVGGPLAYLLYLSCQGDRHFQFLLFQPQAMPVVSMFTWIVLTSELISCIGEQWLLSKNGFRSNYWLLSHLLGLVSAGIVGFLLPNWLPTIGYVGLWVGLTSGFTLWYCTKHSSREGISHKQFSIRG